MRRPLCVFCAPPEGVAGCKRGLNGFTCNARMPSQWHSGALCLLVETDEGLVLVDTGIGREDYVRKPGVLRAFAEDHPEVRIATGHMGLGFF